MSTDPPDMKQEKLNLLTKLHTRKYKGIHAYKNLLDGYDPIYLWYNQKQYDHQHWLHTVDYELEIGKISIFSNTFKKKFSDSPNFHQKKMFQT